MAISTTLDLPGVYRIEEASNKALRNLYQQNRRTKISIIAADEGVIYQPGDVINLSNTNRGVSLQLWVESVTMVGYGRYKITGREYAGGHVTDDYVTAFDNSGGASGGTSDSGDDTFFGEVDAPGVCKVYACSAYANGLLALEPVAYYPMNIAADLADYPSPDYIKDYSTLANHSYATGGGTPTVQAISEISGNNNNCSGQISYFNTQTSGGTPTTVDCNSSFATISEWVNANNYTYLVNAQGAGLSTDDIGRFRYEIDSGGRWTGCRLYTNGDTVYLYLETEGWAGTTSKLMTDIDANWRQKVIGFRTIYSGANSTTMELLFDFAPVSPSVSVTRDNSLTFGQLFSGPQHISSTGYFTGAKIQESVLYNRALSDGELAALKLLWDQSKSTYTDPNPYCIPASS